MLPGHHYWMWRYFRLVQLGRSPEHARSPPPHLALEHLWRSFLIHQFDPELDKWHEMDECVDA